jgi:hypothetical protein
MITNLAKLQKLISESKLVTIIENKPGEYKAYAFKTIVDSDGANVDIVPISETLYKKLYYGKVIFPIAMYKILPDKLNELMGVIPPQLVPNET